LAVYYWFEFFNESQISKYSQDDICIVIANPHIWLVTLQFSFSRVKSSRILHFY